MTTFAGQTGGAVDGPGNVALFHGPTDVAKAPDGSIYVADYVTRTIRKISPAGVVSTFAGIAYGFGSQNGRGSEARFNNPSGLATDSSGNLYVTDVSNHMIRKITPGGVVTTLAGALPQGSVDGTGADARFFLPGGIATDHHGNVYVSDLDHTIRKITPAGVVTTFAGLAGVSGSANGNGNTARFSWPEDIEVDGDGNIYVADAENRTIRKITPDREVTTFAGSPGVIGNIDGSREDARFFHPSGLAFDNSGNLYVSEYYTIRKITPGGQVTTLAGLAGAPGYVDANGSDARFLLATGLVADDDGNLYVTDSNMIRRITPDGTVSTVAGRPGGTGFTDGAGTNARFFWPYAASVDAGGNVYICDRVNQNIRKITPAGEVSTFAGPSSGFVSIFNHPRGVAVDADGFVYVADTDNSTIRKISPSGTVTTLAGLALSTGSTDATGESARFNKPAGVAVRDGIVYVADMNNHTIRKILANGEVSTLAGLALNSGTANGTGSAARFNSPEALAVDGLGFVYVSDTLNHAIRKISPAGEVTTLAGVPGANPSHTDGTGSAARFSNPKGIALDTAGNLYVAESIDTIRMITPAGVVTTVAGLPLKEGSADGTGSVARFRSPSGVAVGTDGRVYITDMVNSTVRVGVPALPDAATIDVNDGPAFVPRQLDTAPQTATAWTWSIIRRPAGSSNDVSAISVRDPTFVPDTSGLFTFQLLATAASDTSITTVDLTVPAPPPVDLGPPASFSATALSATQVALTWTAVSGATYYEIFRSSAGGAFILHNSCPNAGCSDFNVTPNTTYLYKVRAIDDDGPSSFGAVDPATTTAFTDHPLGAGTRAKAVHLLELRTAVNAMRAAAGLGSATFTTTVAPGSPIQAGAIDELRTAVDAARTALGLPGMTYDDATLIAHSTLLKTAHVAQLREAVE
ncbi:MAG TPA: hypothetical protein VFV49_14535 [Thermoanaerobaculia bacterium]|nr:hypothetical protein [Thermoanaerobaculia bacterium]